MAPPKDNNDDNKLTSPFISIFPSLPGSSKYSNTSASERNPAPAPVPETKTSQPKYICSPVTSSAASLLLHRRLLLPVLFLPTFILLVPAFTFSCLSCLAYQVAGGRLPCVDHNPSTDRDSFTAIALLSMSVILSTWFLTKAGFSTIEKHAPNEHSREEAYLKSRFALPFWSFVISLAIVRTTNSAISVFVPFYNSNTDIVSECESSMLWGKWILGLFNTWFYWATKVGRICIRPALGWAMMSVLVICRYAGPFCPITRCSSAPLRTNPFDMTLKRVGQNFTSTKNFLDMIATGLDKLSSPSVSTNSEIPPTEGKLASKHQTVSFASDLGSNSASQQSRQSNSEMVWKSIKSLVNSSEGMRYSRPNLFSILVQFLLHSIGGCLFARFIIVPLLKPSVILFGSGVDSSEMTVVSHLMLSCTFAAMVGMSPNGLRHEIRYRHYCQQSHSSQVVYALLADINHCLERDIHRLLLIPPVISGATLPAWLNLAESFFGQSQFSLSSSKFLAIVQSFLASYFAVAILVIIVTIQDVLTKWVICAPGLDPDALLFHTPMAKNNISHFLAEDLFIQSILMGDGTTVQNVVAFTGADLNHKSVSSLNHQGAEMIRNNKSITSFSEWLRSPSKLLGSLSDDILRLSLLESLGGGGTTPPASITSHSFYFGKTRHSAAIRKRLELAAAASAPGRQPIAVPLIRALCAFAGGMGEAATQCFSQKKNDAKPIGQSAADVWMLPPGSLDAAEFALIAAARLVVMNWVNFRDSSRRLEMLKLLMPPLLESAHKLRCGVFEYGHTKAKRLGLIPTPNEGGSNGDDVENFILLNSPDLRPVISACDNSAKMVIQAMMEAGNAPLENSVLVHSQKTGLQKWLVEMKCQVVTIRSSG